MNRPAILDLPALIPIWRALPQARLVGGCVRDTLAGCPVSDIDLATPEPPDVVKTRLERAGLRVVPTGIAHGTVTALSGNAALEITTLRRDVRTDGRRAQVAWTEDFEEDAARRDFTMNAMSLDRAGRLYDPFGGQADLAERRVRFVGEAAVRIAEDRLRILRYFRFYTRYGAPPPDPEATRAIADAAPGLDKLSAERVWSELKRILIAADPRPALALMAELGVLRAVLPEAGTLDVLDNMLVHGAPANPVLRLSALLTNNVAVLAERLRFSTAEQDLLAGLITGPVPAPGDDDAALRRLLADEPGAVLIGRVWRAYPEAAELRERLKILPRPIFPLEGRHALAAGFLPSPQVGQALREVRAWWREGGCTATLPDCQERLAVLAPNRQTRA